MIFKTNIVIPWKIEDVFNALNAPSMMQRVAWPLVVFKAVRPSEFPERWQNDGNYRMNMYLLGFLPLGWQELSIQSNWTDTGAVLIDSGPGFAIKLWDHRVVLSEDEAENTCYDETLKLTTGLMAPIIWLGMKVLFAWRKHRWMTITKKEVA